MDKNIINLNTFEYFKNVIIPVIFYSTIAGACVGLVVSAYNFAAGWISSQSVAIYTFVKQNVQYTPLLFLGLIALAMLMYWLLKKVPEVKGSGIPRSEGIVRGLLSFKWYRLAIGTIVGSFISFLGGLSLGSEGPSVQLGTATASGAGAAMRGKYAWRRYVSTGGASAGIAVAFGAPITGVMFAIEEGHRQFNPLLLLTAIVSVIASTFVARLISPLMPYEDLLFGFFGEIKAIEFSKCWVLLLLGIICGLTAAAFNQCLLFTHKVDKANSMPLWFRLIAVFVISGIAGLVYIESLGSGYAIITKIMEMDFALKSIAILLAIKFVLIILGYSSRATGGLFIPMLTMGALVGGLSGHTFIAMGMDASYYSTIVAISMVAFLGACIRTPFTALIMLAETTRPIIGFVSAGIVICIAFMMAETCMRRPLYDVLLEKELEAANTGKVISSDGFDVQVKEGSFAAGKTVREILWPTNCRISVLFRDGGEIVAEGKTKLQAGDILHVRADNCDMELVSRQFRDLLN